MLPKPPRKLTITDPDRDIKMLVTSLPDDGITFVFVPSTHIPLFKSLTPGVEWEVLDSNLLRKEV